MDRTSGFSIPVVLQAMAAAAAEQVGQWLRAAQRARSEREARRALHRLSDHLLRDLGLHRSQIDSLYRERR